MTENIRILAEAVIIAIVGDARAAMFEGLGYNPQESSDRLIKLIRAIIAEERDDTF